MVDAHAVFYEGSKTMTPRPVGLVPTPASGEVQIDVAYNGICGTDLHIFHGLMDDRVEPPAIIGHEMAGTIAAVGPAVTGWSVGDPVTVMPLDWCNECPACSAGHQHICHNLNFVGIDSSGAIRRLWNVRHDLLVALPPGLDLDVAALTEPLAVAVHDVRRGGVRAGDDVVVIGGGPIGMLIGLYSQALGAVVVISEPDQGRRSIAAELGLDSIDPGSCDLRDEVARRTGGKGADVAFEVSATGAGARALTDVLRTRGVGVVVGIHSAPPPIDLFGVFWREIELRGARVYERRDFERAVELLSDATIPARSLISDIIPAAQAQSGFERLDAGGPVLKVLIDCRAFGP